MQLLKNYGVISGSSPRHKLLDAYVNAMTTRMSGQHQWLVNRMLRELQDGGYPMTGVIHLLNGETEQASLINLLDATQLFVKNGTPTFTPNVGWNSPATTSFLLSNYNFSNIAGWTPDDSHISVWCLNNVNANAADVFANTSIYGPSIIGYTTTSSYGMYGYNGGTNGAVSGLTNTTSSIGFSMNTRLGSAAGAQTLYRNGVQTATGGNTRTVDVSASPIRALSQSGGAANRQLAIITAGSSLTAAQAVVQYNAFNRLLSAW